MENSNAAGANSIPFKIQKDGNGVEHKIVDLDHESIPKVGSIQIQAVSKKNKRKGNKMQYKMVTDKLSGIKIGIFTGIDRRTGELQWLPINVYDGAVFNREIRDEAQKAFVVLNGSIIEGSPNQSENGKLVVFRVYDEVKAAEKTLIKIVAGQKAVTIAKGLSGNTLVDMARNLGISTRHTNFTIILAEVCKAANDNPEEFLRIWENPHRESITIFKKGLEQGLITFDINNGYSYGGVPLGMTEAAICEYFEKNPHIRAAIESRAKVKAGETKIIHAPKVEVVDHEKEELKRRIAELESRSEKTEPPSMTLEDELEYWKARAREIGGELVKGLHHFNATRDSIDKLITKVQKAKTVGAA